MNYAILFFLIGLNFILVYMIPKKEQDSVKRAIKEFNYNNYMREYKTLNIFFLVFNIAFIALDIIYEKSFIVCNLNSSTSYFICIINDEYKRKKEQLSYND